MTLCRQKSLAIRAVNSRREISTGVGSSQLHGNGDVAEDLLPRWWSATRTGALHYQAGHRVQAKPAVPRYH